MPTDQDGQAAQQESAPETGGERRPWGVIIFLLLIVVGVAIGAFVMLTNLDTEPETADDIASAAIGVWVTEDSPEDVTIEFTSNNEYGIRNFQGRVIDGTWTVTEDGLIEAPVAYHSYQGTWYFEPVSAEELHLEVPELEIDWSFHKTP
jgi:hypothetical protein